MNIIIIAYASEPGAGSEYGVGWMVPVTMAKRYAEHEIYVLTRSRCKDKIMKALDEMQLKNLHFLFYDIPSWMTYPNEMKSRWGEQINYLTWQLLSRRFIKKMDRKIGFDVIHHLTFNQYRTPSAGFWMKQPFVMGPIGGAEVIAPCFWQDLEVHSVKKELMRQKGKDLKVFGWFNTRSHNRKLILCSCKENMDRLQPFAHESELRVMPAIAYDTKDFEKALQDESTDIAVDARSDLSAEGAYTWVSQKDSNVFEMVYAGKAWDWKGILIFLKAVRNAFNDGDNYRVKLIGIRFEEEQKRVMSWVNKLGLEEHVTLIPFIKRDDLLKLMKTCQLSVYPAFRDSGSMSILEACALACPSICFEAGGQDIFPDDILLKVPVSESYEEAMNVFARKLKWAYGHRIELKEIGARSQKWVEANMLWQQKVDEFVKIYNEISK